MAEGLAAQALQHLGCGPGARGQDRREDVGYSV